MAELRQAALARASGYCEWPGCADAGEHLAHEDEQLRQDRLIYGESFTTKDGKRIDPLDITPAGDDS